MYGVVKSQTQLSNQAQHMDKYKVVCIGGGMIYRASLVAQLVKNPPAMQAPWVQSLVRKFPWRRDQLPTPVFWPGEFHGLYSLWGSKESDTTE